MKTKSLPYFRLLLVATLINLVVLFIRGKTQGTHDYDFLVWNLFLGFLPLLVAWILNYFEGRLSNFIFYFASFIWLIFYPNAPYMISDVIHVEGEINSITRIFNGLIIFSLAMLSLFYGFLSIKIMHRLFENKLNKKWANVSLFLALLLSCLAFYMGRIIRLNSWQVITEPLVVIRETIEGLFPIGAHLDAYVLMLLFGGIQYMLLQMMKDVNDVKR